MHWLYYFILVCVLIAGLFINLLGLPGLWLMVGGVGLYAWLTSDAQYVSGATLIVIVILALAAEVVEFVAGSAGAAKAGASKRAMFGAIIGGLLGGFFFTFVPIPIISTIVGVCLGCFVGAAVTELIIFEDVKRSLRVGVGAAKGRFYGIMSKLAFGIAILLITLIAAFPVGESTPQPAATLPTTLPSTTFPSTLP